MLVAIWQTSLAFAPFLLLGAALSGVLHVALPKDWLRHHLGGRLGVLKAVLFGIPLPLCSCGVIPAGLGLRKDGASRGAAVGFMISTPQTGVDSILVSASMLGWPFAFFKVMAALVTGLVGGMLTNLWVPDDAGGGAAESGGHDGTGSPWRRGWDHTLMILQSVWRWVVFGIVVSAVLSVWVPQSVWQALSAAHPAWSMLGALLISVPLYVCATASVPIAAALVMGGLPAGAALVFLMAGPATNVATLGAIYRTLGGRTTVIYLAVVVVFSLALGASFDTVLPAKSVAAHVHGGGQVWEWVLAAAMWSLMAYFLFDELRAFFRAPGTSEVGGAGRVEMDVEGMTCNGCVRKLEQTLVADPRVERAVVTLQPQRVQIDGRLTIEEAAELVASAGFKAGPNSAVVELDVEGMTCQGCVRKLERTFADDERVESAAVSLSPQQVRVAGRLNRTEVEALVVKAGFRVASSPGDPKAAAV